MDCSCIKKFNQAFDFKLDSYDCKFLILEDMSNWMEGSPYIISETFPITITTPNGSNLDLEFKPKGVTKYTAKDLGMSACIDDGIYCFKVNSCGYNFSRNRAVLCTMKCKLDSLVSKANKDEDWNKITEITNLIYSIEVNSEMGNELISQELYKMVNKEFQKLNCDCSCRS